MKAPTTQRYAGALLALDGVLLRGWAIDQADPHQKVAVELIADGQPIALACANGCDAALPADVQGHVFRKLLPESVLRATHRLTARIANTDCLLEPVLSPSAALGKGSSANATSWVLNQGGLRISGVLVAPAGQGGGKPRLRLRVDGEWLDWVIADKLDPELLEAGIGDGRYAFDVTLPIRYADGRPHKVQAFAADGSELPGSPLAVLQFPRAPRAWLQTLGLAEADLGVLDELLKAHERLRPMSLGWEAYPEWKQRFGSSPAPSSTQRVLVVMGPSADWKLAQRSLDSLCAQSHDDWRALVWTPADGELPKHPDARIEFVRSRAWSVALQSSIKNAVNIASLEMDDTWQPELLRHALAQLKGGADVTYCDADDNSGGPPWFKPDWCPDTFLQLPLLEHGFVFRTRAIKQQLAKLSVCPLDWPWQIISLLGADARVAHIPHPLHSRGDGKPASTPRLATPAAARPAPAEWVKQTFGVQWQAASGDGPHQIQWPDPADWPSVCLIIPTRDAAELLRSCIDSLLQTDYPHLSLCVVDNQSSDEDALAYLAHLETMGIRLLQWPYPFNFSAINNFAVEATEAEVVGLINNDVRALDAGWLKAMVRQLVRPGVAAVGAKLLWPNRMVQHLGDTLGMQGVAGHTGNQWRDTDAGYHHLNRITRTVSAVTAACLLVRRADYLAVGGMDHNAFPVNFNDVDLCLRLGEQVGRVVVTPEAVLEHAESATRGTDQTPEGFARLERERANLQQKWSYKISNDQFYNLNLNLERYSHNGLAFPPRGQDS